MIESYGKMKNETDINTQPQVLQRQYMVKIAICDDEKHFRDDVSSAVSEYSSKHEVEAVVDEYDCGEDLLESADKYDIIVLDYQMGGISGLETAKHIREKNILCTIIFITNHPSFVYESFEVRTFRFFEKPLDVEKFHKALDDYFLIYGNDYPIQLKIGRETVCVNTRDIVYIEADNKKCYINLVDKQYHCAKAMAEIAKLLPSNIFYKVHKSFVVNFNYVSSYDSKNIYFVNGTTAHVSRKNLASFKDAYRTFAKSRNI